MHKIITITKTKLQIQKHLSLGREKPQPKHVFPVEEIHKASIPNHYELYIYIYKNNKNADNMTISDTTAYTLTAHY